MKLTINREKYLVKRNNAEIFLPRKEFEILWVLCSVPGKVFSRNQIFETVWDNESVSKPRTVDVHIVNIRKKLGDDLIRTIKGVGYKITIENIEVKY